MSRKPNAPPPRFPWRLALSSAFNAGTWGATASAGGAAATGAGSAAIATYAAFGFCGGVGASLSGEIIKHRLDDPAPVFDGPTTLLFDTAGMVIGLLLFFIPALQLDRALHPDAALPGVFGFAALFLTAFFLPVLRGLLCNLGLARTEEDHRRTQI